MSKTIEEHVISMQFDNKHFEKNTAVTMSTIDKLKQKLNFTGASKGLENIGTAAGKVNMNGLGTAIDTVHAKFSALDVIGVTALANITNSAIQAGKRMVSALTVAPISDGFREYEMTLNAVQTTMAGTGKTAAEVEAQLKRLDKYADDTIYSSADMFNNLPKFTNAGVDLEKAATAMIGIANATAIAGGDATKASIAFYNLGQSIGTGYLTRMDYNSINNAGIATMEWKNQMVEAAIAQGKLTKAGEDAYVAGNKTFTMQQLFIDGLQEQWATADVLTKVFGDYGDVTTEIGAKAQASAQNIKTFTMMMESLKATAGTGWKDTWQIIFGDLESATKFWTSVNNSISKVITGFADARNNLLEGALGSKWDSLTKKIEEAGVSTDDFQKKLKDTAKENGVSVDDLIEKYGSLDKAFQSGKLSTNLVTKTLKSMAGEQTKTAAATEDMTEKLKYFQKVVDEVWHGDYKNGKERIEALTKSGYDYSKVQNLVNKTVDGHKLTLEDLSETQLKAVGYTEKEIEAISKLAKEAEKAGTPLNQLIKDLTKPSGRELLGKSFTNMFQPVLTIINSIKTAWKDAFPPMQSNPLYTIIENLHTFSKYLIISKDAANDLTRTFKGVFAILDMISMVLGGGFRIGFSIVTKILSTFWEALGFANVNILKVTASIGDVIVAVRDWIEEHSLINKAIETVVPLLVALGKAAVSFVKSIGEIPAVKKGIEGVAKAFSDIGKAIGDFFGAPIKSLERFVDILNSMENVSLDGIGKAIKECFNVDFSNISFDMISGFVNGLQAGAGRAITAIMEFGISLLEGIKDVLGIHSPSTETREVGVNFVEGFINGIKSMFSTVGSVIKDFATRCLDLIKSVDWGTVFAGGLSIGLILTIRQFASAINKLSAPMEGLGALFEGAGEVLEHSAKGIGKILKNTAKVVKSFSKVLNSFAFSVKAKALKDIAISLAILVGAVIALSFIDPAKLWQSVAIVTALSAVLVALSFAVDKMSSASASIGKDGAKIGGFKTGLLTIAASLLLLSIVVKKIGSMDTGQAIQGFIGLGVLVAAIAGVIAAYGLLVKADAAGNMDKAGKLLFKMSVSLLLMTAVIKLLSGMSIGDMIKGGVAIAAFVGIMTLMSKMAKVINKDQSIGELGGMMIKMSIAMILMVGVIKLVSGLSAGDMVKGAAAILGFVGIVALLSKVVKVLDKGQSMAKLGSTLLAMSISMMLLTLVIKMISKLSVGDMIKGGAAILAFTGVIYLLIKMVDKVGHKVPKVAGTLIAMSVSIGILAAVSVMLSLINLADLAKGVAAITMLGAVMTAMIWATRGANNVRANLIVMTVAIGIMAAAVTALSFIDPTKLAGASIALSMVMGMFALIAKMSSNITSSIAPLIVMTAAVGMLAGILYLLSGLPIESTITVAASLSMLMASLAVSMLVISKAGLVAPTALITLGIMTLVVGALAAILYLLSGLPVESTIAIAASLSLLLITLSGVCLILAAVGATGPAAFIGIGALVALIGGVGALMIAIGALVTYIPAMEEFLDKGIVVLQKIGYGLGSFVGNIVAGFTESVLSGLPTIGTQLSAFMANIQPFINGAKQIDPKMMSGVKSLAETILILTGTNLLDSLTSWFTGGVSLANFGEELAKFGPFMAQYAEAVKGIDATAVTASANAAKALSEMANNIPKEGGLVSFFTGENDLDKFGTQLITFGKNLKAYSLAVVGINIEAVNASATAAKGLVELANTIPNTGGLVSWLTGDNDIGEFGTNLVKFGTGLKDYATKVTDLNVDSITGSVKAAEGLVKLSETIPSSGGFWAWLAGDNDIGDFGDKLIPFGEGLKTYSNTVGGIVIENVNNSITAAKGLVSMIDSMAEIDTKGVNPFKNALNTLAEVNITKVVQAFNGDTSKLIAVGTDMINFMTEGMSSKQSSLNSTISKLITNMINAINSKKSEFKTAGTKIINEFVSGIDNNASKVKSSMTKTLDKVVSSICSYYDDFHKAGEYLVSGFASGISANTYLASAKAKAMAEAASEAAKKALNEHSPSKVFYGIGDFAGKGFVNALSDYASISYNAGTNIADSARKGLNNAIGKVADIINSDIDSQPTIRPVLDLSNVSSGARSINGMFDAKQSVGVMTHINAISSAMGNNQNGVNDDVVSAINKLRKDLGNIGGGSSISIGGITYDNGSAVYKAVEALIRAAKIEGRV